MSGDRDGLITEYQAAVRQRNSGELLHNRMTVDYMIMYCRKDF